MTPQVRYQRKAVAEGRCCICRTPHTGGTQKCRACLTKDNGRTRRRRARWKAEGRCVNCGAMPLGPTKYTRCLDCRVKAAAGEARRREAA